MELNMLENLNKNCILCTDMVQHTKRVLWLHHNDNYFNNIFVFYFDIFCTLENCIFLELTNKNIYEYTTRETETT